MAHDKVHSRLDLGAKLEGLHHALQVSQTANQSIFISTVESCLDLIHASRPLMGEVNLSDVKDDILQGSSKSEK